MVGALLALVKGVSGVMGDVEGGMDYDEDKTWKLELWSGFNFDAHRTISHGVSFILFTFYQIVDILSIIHTSVYIIIPSMKQLQNWG